MPKSQKDHWAAEAIDRWVDFQESLSSEKRKYPIQQFQAFWSATERYAKLTKADALIHKVSPPRSTDSSISSARNASVFQTTFCGTLSAWSASFLADMTHTSRATNRQDCEAILAER